MRFIYLSIFLCGLCISPAHAEDGEIDGDIVGVLSIETQGVSATAGDMLEASVEEGLIGSGFTLVRSSAMADTLAKGQYLRGCQFGPCLSHVFQATGIRLVLVARISGEGTSYNFVISLIDTRSGQPTSQVAERCDVCTVEEAILTATSSVIAAVTGTGDARVEDPEVGPAGSERLLDLRDYRSRAEFRRAKLRRTGWVGVGLGAAAGLAGLYVKEQQSEAGGYALMGLGVGGLLGGTALLSLSTTF